MTRPLEHGDVCEVVGGLGRTSSPNIGLRVVVQHRIMGAHGMDHTTLGPVYRCAGDGVQQLTDAGTYQVMGWADFAGVWLRRIEPPAAAPTRDACEEARA